MEKLDLDKLGVKDLEPESLQEVSGGFWLMALGLFCSYVIVEAALNPSAHIQAFKEGYAMAE